MLSWHFLLLQPSFPSSSHHTDLTVDVASHRWVSACKKDVTPLLTHWSYVFLALTHRRRPYCTRCTSSYRYKQTMIERVWHAGHPLWPQCKRSGLTLIEVSQHAYSSYQAFSLPSIFYHVIFFATWCNWLDFYWCWIKFCLSLSLSLSLRLLLAGSLSHIAITLCLTPYIDG